MDIKQALSILRPEVNNADGLKAAYRAACMKHHPDKGGNPEIMKLVNLAMETLTNCDRWWTAYEARQANKTAPLTETLSKLWDAVKTFPGINGEIIGSWLWVSGDTRKYKDQLKAAGFRFSRNKSAWYYHEDKFREKSRRSFSMDNLRDTWGSSDLEPETAAALD